MKEIYCERCGDFEPLRQDDPYTDVVNQDQWFDLMCDRCKSVITTVRVKAAELLLASYTGTIQ